MRNIIIFIPGSGNARGDNVAIFFTSSLSSESQTSPHLRSAPFRVERLTKLGNAIITARKEASEREADGLAPGEFLITMDGQKPGNNSKLNKLLKRFGRKLLPKTYNVFYDCDAKLARTRAVVVRPARLGPGDMCNCSSPGCGQGRRRLG